MVKKTLAALVVAVLLYLLLWPVPIDPVAWNAPPNPGYAGSFAANTQLAAVETLALAGQHGPEDVAIDSQGRIYASTHEGFIVRLEADGSGAQKWVHTGGRPLGIEFDRDGNLIVADAFRGLLSISPAGDIDVLATVADGIDIVYADDLDIAQDGRVYFSDASTKFSALANSGTYQASLLDLIEHGGHGRLLVFDPQGGNATTLLDGLEFANGVAVSPDQTFVLVNETGAYRVLRYWLQGEQAGQSEVLLASLPGFPDNLSAGRDGRFWLGLASPRSDVLDRFSASPLARRVIQRLPAFVRPKAQAYGHVIAFDRDGRIVANLQDPAGAYPLTTGVTETDDYLYVSSLVAPVLARLPRPTE